MENTVVLLLLLCACCSTAPTEEESHPDLHNAIQNVSSSLDKHTDMIEELWDETQEQTAVLKELQEKLTQATSVKKEIQSSYMLSSMDPPGTYSNVGLRGKATQSDQHDAFSAAYNAIDGNRDSNYNHGSCAVTKLQDDPWWRVDLLEPYIVTSIIIATRGDCCPENLDGAEIYVGNSLQDNGNDNPLVARLPHIPAGESQTITFTSKVEGRYVSVFLPGSDRQLSICEMEVYGYRAPTGENLALKGKASQSSLYDRGFAYNAIDGSRESNYTKGSCQRTQRELNPWWRLDLGKKHRIFSVLVTNTDDHWLRDVEIRIGDSLRNNGNDNPRCAVMGNVPPGSTQEYEWEYRGWTQDYGVPPGSTQEYRCNGTMDGRYINIVNPGHWNDLHVCEVEVYGSVLD